MMARLCGCRSARTTPSRAPGSIPPTDRRRASLPGQRHVHQPHPPAKAEPPRDVRAYCTLQCQVIGRRTRLHRPETPHGLGWAHHRHRSCKYQDRHGQSRLQLPVARLPQAAHYACMTQKRRRITWTPCKIRIPGHQKKGQVPLAPDRLRHAEIVRFFEVSSPHGTIFLNGSTATKPSTPT